MQRKKIVTWILSTAMISSMLPATVFAADSNAAQALESFPQAVTAQVSPELDLPSNDELFALYAEQVLYGYEMATFGTMAWNKLNPIQQNIYDVLKPQIKTVSASGGSTVFEIPASEIPNLQTSWTFKDDVTKNEAVAHAQEQLNAQITEEMWSGVVDALLSDCPFDLYWFDKLKSTSFIANNDASISWNSSTKTVSLNNLTFISTFKVVTTYQDGNDTTVIADVEGIKKIKEKAQGVVDDNINNSPYERLVAYKEYICKAVSYNYDAAADGYVTKNGYGDPWQLIYVFDEDSSTKVVCEGYAKAFQYLCDLDDALDEETTNDFNCISPTGDLGYLVPVKDEQGNPVRNEDGTIQMTEAGGPHMWNVVTLKDANNQNINYLVDVTNCDDEKTEGGNTKLFLKGAPQGTNSNEEHKDDNKKMYPCVYTFNSPEDPTYYYCENLGIAADDYGYVVTYPVIVNGSENGTVTVSPANAAAGAEVTLTVTPDEGYELDELTVMQGETSVEVADNKFTMPEGGVTVTATFKNHEHNLTYTAEGTTITATCSCGNPGSITLTAVDKTYDGQAFVATVDKTGTLAGVDVTVTYDANDTSSTVIDNKVVNAGNYTATLKMREGVEATVNFAITAKNITNATVVFGEMTYTGQSQTPVATVTIDGLEATGSWSQVINVADKTTFTADGNFTGTLTKDPGMKKATPIVTAPVAVENLTYETNTSYDLVTAGSSTGGELQYSLDENGTYGAKIPVGTNARTYTVWYKVVGDTNHKDTPAVRVDVTIKPKEVTPTVAFKDAAGTVDGKPYYLHTESAITPAFDLMDGQTVIPATEYNDAEYANNIQVGTATITVKDKANGNYTFTDVTATFDIKKHEHMWKYTASGNTITATCQGGIGACPLSGQKFTLNPPAKLTYDGKAKEATITGSIDGVVTPTITYSGDNFTASEAINAGNYIATIILGEGENVVTATVSFTIAKAEQEDVPELTVNAPSLKGKADGSISGLTTAMEYAITEDGEYTAVPEGTTEWTGLATGTTYYVRYKETVNYKAGTAAEVVVGEGKPITVIFNANGKTFASEFSAQLENQSYGTKFTKPTDPKETSGDFVFGGWYKDAGCTTAWNFETDTLTPTEENVTLYAQWKQVRFNIQVDVKRDNTAYTGEVTVTLMRGSETTATVTGTAPFTFEHVDTGVYNLVAAYADGTKTELVTIDKDDTITINLPAPGVKSQLTVKDDSNTPDIMVGGLDKVAAKVKENNPDAAEVTVTMDIEGKKESQVSNEVVEKIEEAITGSADISLNTVVEYLNINIMGKIGDADAKPIIDTEENVLEIVVPFNFAGRNGIKVIHYHGNSAVVLDPLDNKPAADSEEDGKYWMDTTNGYIYIYSKQFSPYAISYTTAYTITFDVNGGEGSNSTMTTNGNGTVTLPTNPTRSGYTFNGWYTAPTGGEQITASTVFSGDTTVYAQWTQNYYGGGNYDGGDYSAPTYAVSVPTRVENGTVSVSSKNTSKGSTVTLTVTPDEGYELDTLIVTDKNGKEITLIDKGNGKFSFTMPASKIDIKATFVEIPDEPEVPVNPFYDVAEGDYFFNAVQWANENGITSGVGNGQFAPHATCTRAQMVTFLRNAAGCPNVSADYGIFNDVAANDYYYKAVLWANANKITSGTGNGAFSPDQICTRAQMATFLYKFAEGKAEGSSNPFADVTASDYYAKPVQWAVENGITSGTGANTFGPADPCTRAQMVTFLYRLLAE